MDGEKIVGGVITLVVAGVIGFFAIDLFSTLLTSPSVAIEQGKPLYRPQRGIIGLVANHLHFLIGGVTLVLLALGFLAVYLHGNSSR